jgi:hypothetical protein
MSHSVVRLALASDLITDGTLTVTYPTGKGKGNFINGADHRMFALQKDMRVGRDFTISFGNTSATVTYKGTTTIPQSSEVLVQLDEAGKRFETLNVLKRSVAAAAILVTLGSPATLDADGICASQSVTSGEYALLNGALATSGQSFITLDVPRALQASWTTSAVLTVTGRDEYGNTMVEKSASGTTFTGKKAFKYVDSVTFSASVTSATVGTTDVLGLPFFLRDTDMIVAEYEGTTKVGVAPGQKVYVPFEIEQTELLAPTNEQIVAPVAGTITGFRGIVQGAVTTGGAVTLKIGTTDVTGASITLANSDAAGVTYNSTAITAANTVAAGDRIQVVPAAAIDTAGQLNGVVEITASGNGTYVVGDQGAASGTSGDVRGTFDPLTACDGVTGFSLVVLVDDPNYLGAPQYAG